MMLPADPTLIIIDDGLEVCPECGHVWTDDGPAHEPDCRFFFLEEEREEEVPAEHPEIAHRAA